MGIYGLNVCKASGHSMRAFNHEADIYQVVTHTTTIAVERENIVMK